MTSFHEDIIGQLDILPSLINDRFMTPYEYEKAKKRIGLQQQIVENLKIDNPHYAKELQKYLEMVITVKGHAWCMDVVSERRKMPKLVTNAMVDSLKSRGV